MPLQHLPKYTWEFLEEALPSRSNSVKSEVDEVWKLHLFHVHERWHWKSGKFDCLESNILSYNSWWTLYKSLEFFLPSSCFLKQLLIVLEKKSHSWTSILLEARSKWVVSQTSFDSIVGPKSVANAFCVLHSRGISWRRRSIWVSNRLFRGFWYINKCYLRL